MTIAVLPNGTTVEEVAATDGIAPGLLSAVLAPAGQTYLDITQGNRVSDSLYDEELPPDVSPQDWDEIRARAADVPADIRPGLLAQVIHDSGRSVSVEPRVGRPALLAIDEDGRYVGRPDPAVRVIRADPAELDDAVDRLPPGDLLIAFAGPPPSDREQLAIGIAGAGFDGNLTSDSTRMNGYVLTTDLAPTILEHLGLPVPDEMSGSPIRSEDRVDLAAITDLRERFEEIAGLRATTLAAGVAAWLLAAALALLIAGGRHARPIVQLLALTIMWAPLASLIGHAPGGEWAERLIFFGLPPLLAAATRRLLPGYAGLAVACLVTALAYAIDVVAGSTLTTNSLMGPTPGLGIRFYGIGNTLEATLVPLVIGGTGAALAAYAPRLPARGSAAVFLATGLLAAVVFALGRFGADVGAAIVFPVGAVTAAIVVLGGGRNRLWLIAAVPLGLLGAIALIDVVTGGNAHFTRSVLEAGSLDELADVAERRLTLSAQTFEEALTAPFLPLTLVLLGLGVWQRERVRGWLGRPQYRAAWAGVAVATLISAVANDSGALLLMVGTAYATALAAFAWAEA